MTTLLQQLVSKSQAKVHTYSDKVTHHSHLFRGRRGGSSNLRQSEAINSVNLLFKICHNRPVYQFLRYTISHSTPEVIPQLLCRFKIFHCSAKPIIFFTDVVVPIPLPLSAILILVIGTYFSNNTPLRVVDIASRPWV